MKKIVIITCLFIIGVINALAQKETTPLNLLIPQNLPIVSNSLYNRIEFSDNRNNYELKKIAINNISFSIQLNKILQNMIDYTTQGYTMFLQLRNLEVYRNDDNSEVLHIRMTLYEKNIYDYFFIDTFDSEILLSKEEKDYDRIVSQVISDFISDNLNTLQITSQTPVYSLEDVVNIDLIEKDKIEAYKTNILEDGIYMTYIDFAHQIPLQRQFIPNLKKRELKAIKVMNEQGKAIKLSPKDVFAVVINGHLYISNGKKYIEAYKENSDYYIADEVSSNGIGVVPTFSIGIGSRGYRGGGLGLGISTVSHKERVVFKVDHLTGRLAPQ